MLYHVLSNIRSNREVYEKGVISTLKTITSKGIESLLERGAIAPVMLPPMEVVLGVETQKTVKAAGIETLGELLEGDELEAVQEEVFDLLSLGGKSDGEDN